VPAAGDRRAHCSDGELEAVTLRSGERLQFSFLFLFPGALPSADWLDCVITRDKNGFVLTGVDAGAEYPHETSVAGVLGRLRASGHRSPGGWPPSPG